MAKRLPNLVIAALILVPAQAMAQIEPRTCGILDGPGCNPNQCSILDGPGCLAQAQVGALGQNLQLTLGTREAADVRKPEGRLNTLRELLTALSACWTPPPPDNAQSGMQMSMRFSLNRDGRLIGQPQVTYATRQASPKTRELYRKAITQSLQDCMPLPFTRSFAGSIAGRPIVIRVIDDRDNVGPAERRI